MDKEPQFSGELKKFGETIAPRIKKLVEEVESEDFVVIVWGPRETDKSWKKRCQIRDSLNEVKGITAFFPEDSTGKRLGRQLASQLKVPRKDFVAIQTAMNATADLILAFEKSAGPIDEVVYFSPNPKVRAKIVSLLPEKFKATEKISFSGAIRQGITKRYYSDDDLKKCTLATEICVHQARGERLRQRAMTT